MPMVEKQFCYSTAEVERTIFYAEQYQERSIGTPPAVSMLMVVNGEMFLLDEQTSPPWPALSEQAGLVHLSRPEGE
jgi:hypothetical protein